MEQCGTIVDQWKIYGRIYVSTAMSAFLLPCETSTEDDCHLKCFT